MSKIIGEYIDRLTTVEMRPATGVLPRGVIHRMYDAVRAKYDGPLVYRAAKALIDTLSPGDNVVILTGAGCPPFLPNAEIDGIPGAVAIGRALHYGLGVNVTIVTEERAKEPVRATVRAAGMNFRTHDQYEMAYALTYEVSPIERSEGAAHAKDMFGRLNPKAVIAIEKLSPNRAGVIHGATGTEYDAEHTKADEYFSLAEERGILTLGIGDGGNEVGFGVAAEEMRKIMPAGEKCICPCGEGSVAVVATTEFMVAAISDWGGYALGAMLAHMTGVRKALVTPAHVERMITSCVDAGALDGGRGNPELGDDGVPLSGNLAFVEMLNTLIDVAALEYDSPGH